MPCEDCADENVPFLTTPSVKHARSDKKVCTAYPRSAVKVEPFRRRPVIHPIPSGQASLEADLRPGGARRRRRAWRNVRQLFEEIIFRKAGGMRGARSHLMDSLWQRHKLYFTDSYYSFVYLLTDFHQHRAESRHIPDFKGRRTTIFQIERVRNAQMLLLHT